MNIQYSDKAGNRKTAYFIAYAHLKRGFNKHFYFSDNNIEYSRCINNNNFLYYTI